MFRKLLVVLVLMWAATARAQTADIVPVPRGSDIADAALRQELATTLADVRRAYWELVYTADALETARQSEALARTQLDDNRRRRAAGPA